MHLIFCTSIKHLLKMNWIQFFKWLIKSLMKTNIFHYWYFRSSFTSGTIQWQETEKKTRLNEEITEIIISHGAYTTPKDILIKKVMFVNFNYSYYISFFFQSSLDNSMIFFIAQILIPKKIQKWLFFCMML